MKNDTDPQPKFEFTMKMRDWDMRFDVEIEDNDDGDDMWMVMVRKLSDPLETILYRYGVPICMMKHWERMDMRRYDSEFTFNFDIQEAMSDVIICLTDAVRERNRTERLRSK